MVEIILALSCYYGTSSGCIKAAEGYAKYSGLDVKIEAMGRRYEKFAFTMGLLSSIKEKRVAIPYKGYVFGIDLNKQQTEDVKFIIGYNF